MANYYFLISSLPHLEFGATPSLSSSGFLEACEGGVSRAEFESLDGLDLVPREPATSDAERRWNAAEVAIRNTVCKQRSNRLNYDASEFMRPWLDRFAGLEAQVTAVLESGEDPLSVARGLDRLRWQVLDDIGAQETFSYGQLVVYRLKLLLLEKWTPLDREKGARELESMVETKLKSLNIPELANG